MSQALERDLPGQLDHGQLAQGRPAVRSAVMLAAALLLTAVGMSLAYSFVLFVES